MSEIAKLRVGLILDSFEVPEWQAHIVRDLIGSTFASPSVAVVGLSHHMPPSLFTWCVHQDYARYRTTPDSLQLHDITSDLDGIQTHRFGVSNATLKLAEKDAASLSAADFDVIVNLSGVDLRDEMIAPKYGVWSFDHNESGAASAFFWQIYDRNPVCENGLRISFMGTHRRELICQSTSATVTSSLYLNRNGIYWKQASFLLRKLRTLHEYGVDALNCRSAEVSQVPSARGIPSNLATAHFAVKTLATKVFGKCRQMVDGEQDVKWFVALRKRAAGVGANERMKDYQILPSKDDRFYADPMLLQRGGKNYLFVEDFRYHNRKGLISCSVLDDSGRCSEMFEVLERPYHLSYPFLFEWRSDVWMVPESYSSCAIELYRAAAFPKEWTLEKKLLDDIEAVDSTLFCHGGKFWLFTNIGEPGYSCNDELHLFHADTPLGPWEPHRLNPIISDVTRARSAGPIFTENGQHIRPSQDCSIRYGHSTVFNRIDRLSLTEYSETIVGRMGPEWMKGNQGTHTYTRSEDFEAIDGHFRVPMRK